MYVTDQRAACAAACTGCIYILQCLIVNAYMRRRDETTLELDLCYGAALRHALTML